MVKQAHHLLYSNRADLTFWSLLILYYYSLWADFSSRVFRHLFNGSLTSRIFYSKYKGYTWRLIPPAATKTSTPFFSRTPTFVSFSFLNDLRYILGLRP
jgi:hypothetical protein